MNAGGYLAVPPVFWDIFYDGVTGWTIEDIQGLPRSGVNKANETKLDSYHHVGKPAQPGPHYHLSADQKHHLLAGWWLQATAADLHALLRKRTALCGEDWGRGRCVREMMDWPAHGQPVLLNKLQVFKDVASKLERKWSSCRVSHPSVSRGGVALKGLWLERWRVR